MRLIDSKTLTFPKSLDNNIKVFSAGTEPASKINAKAVIALNEVGIDIRNHIPHSVEKFIGEIWDYVITVCDDANETCPVFSGKVSRQLHIGFESPSKAIGSDEFIWSEFRSVRDAIKIEFYELFIKQIKPQI